LEHLRQRRAASAAPRAADADDEDAEDADAAEDAEPTAPSIRAISTTFGNTVQLGIPIVAALFGEAGLSLHVAIVSLHAVTLLTVGTVLAESDLARAAARDAAGNPHAEGPSVVATVAVTARRTVVHPVVLPVLVGLAWNLVGLPVPGPLDEVLAILGQAVVPVCLVLIGMSLAYYGVSGVAGGALAISAGKLIVQPAAVLAAAHWGAGLRGTPLAVVVLCAALPSGSNALLFAQRYGTLEAQTTAGIVASTLAFAVTGPAWLLLVTHLAP
jgi:predicted permease